jgi:RNA-directed DNA polymerase
MEAVVARENLLDAYRRVMSNKGAAGVDEMPVEQLKPYLQEHWARIKEDLLNGTYQPQAEGRRWVVDLDLEKFFDRAC